MDMIPGRLREIRLRRFMTQAELARAAGITEATVNRLEQGLNAARISTIRKLATTLNVSPDDLIDWSAASETDTEPLSQ